ncbi:hypothetical protein KM043_005636 [Ampulex compressa]|nr:hypothetical protein KM043_005636 [Ampulex compressa]
MLKNSPLFTRFRCSFDILIQRIKTTGKRFHPQFKNGKRTLGYYYIWCYGFYWPKYCQRGKGLEAVLKEFAPTLENVPIIIADLSDTKSLEDMTAKAKVIVNCCGPYRFYGEPVVKACIATHTHHVDVSGEPLYMEKMQLEYNKAAQDAGVYIISACGFDSIPNDMGVIFAQQKFGGEVNSVETYLCGNMTKKLSGAIVHYGTWESAIYGYAHANELRGLRTKLYPEKLPQFLPKLKSRGIIHESAVTGCWSAPFPGSDRAVIIRTQRFFYENYKQRPVQSQVYISFNSFFGLLKTALVAMVFGILAKFECGRKLLLKYPAFFSAGFASHEGPLPDEMEHVHFKILVKAQGWTEQLAGPNEEHTSPPNKELIAKVSGVNPGYGFTCTAVLLSAITILKESDKMPHNGGVLTPGAAFSKTSLIEELNNNGLSFEVVSSIEK